LILEVVPFVGSLVFRGSVPGRLSQIFQDLEHKSRRPLRASASEGQRNRGGFKNLLSTRSKVSSTADVILDSAIASLTDADAQGNQLFVLSRECSCLQRVAFELCQFAKGADTAPGHLQVVLFPELSDLSGIIKHENLRSFVR
jgi:hypothetical protein